MKKEKEEFKVEDQYENRAIARRVKYKKNWHPVFWQSATMNVIDDHCYLIGGVSHAIIDMVCILAAKNDAYKWDIYKAKEQVLQRYGHTCLKYEDSLVIFGGQRGSQNKKTKRIVLNDLWIYKPSEDSLEQIMAKRCPDLRYGHCAAIAGHYLIIYGGMNESGEVLHDLWVYDFNDDKWIKVEMTNKNTEENTPPGIWFSQMVSLFYKGRAKNPGKEFFGKYVMNQNMDPFMPKHLREKEKEKELVVEGCYMFGGVTEDNDVTNDLYILKILNAGMKFEWEKVDKINGKPPCERCHHYMEYCEFNNSILVHGGRNDNDVSKSILSDLYYLQVDTLTWIEVKYVYDRTSTPRFSHACSIYGSKLIIFGGVGQSFGMEKSLEIIEMNPDSFPTK